MYIWYSYIMIQLSINSLQDDVFFTLNTLPTKMVALKNRKRRIEQSLVETLNLSKES